LFFVFLWVFLFTLGMYIVFLFLTGFSFFDSRVLQKGYASFSSGSPLYLNGKYLENSERYSQYEVGKYTLCVDEFSKKEKCYNDIHISVNDDVSKKVKSVFLLPSEEFGVSHVLSGKNDLLAFSSDDGAILWYDVFLHQGFYVEEESEGVSSFFTPFEVVSLAYDKKLKRFELKGLADKDVFYVEVDSSVRKEGEYDFKKRFFSLVLNENGFFRDVELELVGVFLDDLEEWYSLENGRVVLFFKESVYLFSPIRNSFEFLSVKDSDFSGMCAVEGGKCFYVNDGLVRVVSL